MTDSLVITGNVTDPRVVRLRDGRSAILRITRPTDAAGVQEFVSGLSDVSRRNRFFAPLRELSPDQLQRVMRSHPPGELALVAESADGNRSRIVGLAQYVVVDGQDAEFAVVVDDAWQRQGLGKSMLALLAEYAERAGLTAVAGFVLADNQPMLELLGSLDCKVGGFSNRQVVRVVKRLDVHKEAAR